MSPDDELSQEERAKLELEQKRVLAQPWLYGKAALSPQAARYSMPMDIRELETMRPMTYLLKHTIVSPGRHMLYAKVYTKYKNKNGVMPVDSILKAMCEVLMFTFHPDHWTALADLTQWSDISSTSTTIPLATFEAVASLAERVFYHRRGNDDDYRHPDDATPRARRELEAADFAALPHRLNDVVLPHRMRHLLEAIDGRPLGEHVRCLVDDEMSSTNNNNQRRTCGQQGVNATGVPGDGERSGAVTERSTDEAQTAN